MSTEKSNKRLILLPVRSVLATLPSRVHPSKHILDWLRKIFRLLLVGLVEVEVVVQPTILLAFVQARSGCHLQTPRWIMNAIPAIEKGLVLIEDDFLLRNSSAHDILLVFDVLGSFFTTLLEFFSRVQVPKWTRDVIAKHPRDVVNAIPAIEKGLVIQ